MNVVNIADKFSLIQEYWSPRIAGELNDSYVKLARLKGEFIWYKEGEFLIVPKGIEHCPVAEEEVHMVMLEPKSTVNTGNV